MADIRTARAQTIAAVSLDWLLSPTGALDDANELETAVYIALLCHRRADPDDVLPTFDDDDRRGWWADLDASAIWDGWPIGSRLWLLSRAKIADSVPPGSTPGSIATPAICEEYIREALAPFIERRIVSSVSVNLSRTAVDTIGGDIILYRGNRDAIALRFETIWQQLRGS